MVTNRSRVSSDDVKFSILCIQLINVFIVFFEERPVKDLYIYSSIAQW